MHLVVALAPWPSQTFIETIQLVSHRPRSQGIYTAQRSIFPISQLPNCQALRHKCVNRPLTTISSQIFNQISGLYYKSFMIVIYDCNDNSLCYKTMIVANLTMTIANLALARSVNYDRKVCCKLKHTFTIVNYDPKPFIVQATD